MGFVLLTMEQFRRDRIHLIVSGKNIVAKNFIIWAIFYGQWSIPYGDCRWRVKKKKGVGNDNLAEKTYTRKF